MTFQGNYESRENPNCRDTFASLDFFGDALDPEAITTTLGLQPDNSARKGDIHKAPSGKVRTAPQGRWIFTSHGKVTSTDLETHVVWILDQLPAHLAPLHDRIVARDGVINCYWLSATGNGGPSFSPETLGRLAAFGLALWFDFYYFSDDDDEDCDPPPSSSPGHHP